MSKDMEITLRLNADGKAMIAAVKKADGTLAHLDKTATKTNSRITQTRQGLISISEQLQATKNQIIGFFALSNARNLVGSLLRTADSVKLTHARLLQTTGSQQAFNQAQSEARAIAKSARADYLSTINLYSRLSTAASQYNVSQAKIAATTKAVTFGLKLYGASAQEVTATQIQLSQALSSGVLQGDEFRSMAEASPRLMQALADGLGVARGELKKLASEGKLTTEIVINALSGQANVLQQEYAQMPLTVADAWGQLKNVAVETISQLDQSMGISDAIANSLLAIANNMPAVTSSLELFFSLMLAWGAYRYLPAFITRIGSATLAWAQAQWALNAAQSAGGLTGWIRNIQLARGTISGTAKALFSLKGAVGVASSAFAGWQIGKWAYNNFSVVRAVGYGVVVQIIDYFDAMQTWLKQVFNQVKGFGVWAMNGIAKAMHWLVTQGKNAGLKMQNAFKSMYLGLLNLTKAVISKIGSGWKGLTAGISNMMAGALTKVRNGLSGLTGFEAFGKKFDLIPDSVLSSLDAKINTLKGKAKDTTYIFDGFDGKINELTQSIAANEKAMRSNSIAHKKFVAYRDEQTLDAVIKAQNKNAVLSQLRAGRKAYNMADISAMMDSEIQAQQQSRSNSPNDVYSAPEKSMLQLTDGAKKAAKATRGAGNAAKKAGKKIKGLGADAKLAKSALKKLKEAQEKAREEAARQKEAVEGFRASQAQRLSDYAFETSLIGKQADEVERLRWVRQLENNAKSASKGLSDENRAKIHAETQSIIAQYDALTQAREALNAQKDNDWRAGINAGLADITKNAGTFYDTMKNATSKTFGSMSDGLANFVATGKGSFRELTVSILQDLSKMMIKASAMRMFGSLFGNLFGGGLSYGVNTSVMPDFTAIALAKGGAFTASGIQYYADGDIFKHPTAFAHAGGLGVMGEAGPEAVMPLTRGPNGKLGVQVYGNQSANGGMMNNITISVNVEDGNVNGDSQSQQAQGRALAENLEGAVKAVMAKEMRPGGMLNNGRK